MIHSYGSIETGNVRDVTPGPGVHFFTGGELVRHSADRLADELAELAGRVAELEAEPAEVEQPAKPARRASKA